MQSGKPLQLLDPEGKPRLPLPDGTLDGEALLRGATITLSNFGGLAGRYAMPVVVPPTVAIIAAGRIRDTAVAWQGQVVAHPVLPVSHAFDHRAVTGGEAARFLAAFIEALQAGP